MIRFVVQKTLYHEEFLGYAVMKVVEDEHSTDRLLMGMSPYLDCATQIAEGLRLLNSYQKNFPHKKGGVPILK